MEPTTDPTSGSTEVLPEEREASSGRALDRRGYPGVPPAVADLWRGWGYAGGTQPEDVATALQGVTSIVNAMAGGDHYAVRLNGSVPTAGTDLKRRAVYITTAALADPRLTVLERLGVTTGMAAHEAGHGRITGPMSKAVERAYKRQPDVLPRAMRLSNIAEDERLERKTGEGWPAYAGLFPLTMWWVANRYPAGHVSRLPESKAEAVNFGLAAIRYRHLTTWSGDPKVQAERAWWLDWADRIAGTDKPTQHVRLIGEALDRMAGLPDVVAPPAPSVPEQPEGGSREADEDGDENNDNEPGWGEPGESEPKDDDEPEGDEPGGSGHDAEDAEDGEDADEDGDGDGRTDGPTEDGEAAGAGNADDDEDDDLGDSSDDGDDGDDDWEPGDGDGDYHHADEPTGPLGEPEDESGGIAYGDSGEDTDLRQPEGGEQDRDALTEPLPMEPNEAVANDDRDRDLTLGRTLAAQATIEARDKITVTHVDGDGVHTRGVTIIPVTGNGVQHALGTSPDVQGALRSAFTSRRTAHDARNVARSGRISGSRAYRVRAGFDTVFTRRDALSPDRLDVHLLIDASGSMNGREGLTYNPNRGRWEQGQKRLTLAATLVANIAEALDHLPFVRVHVWAHNTDGSAILWDVYDSRGGDLHRVRDIKTAGGNNDASVIRALGERILRERSPRERSLMVVMSDGAPCEPHPWVAGAVEAVREKGIGVISVAVTGGLTKTQEACYGVENVVPWENDWDKLGRGIARIMGRLA